MAITFRIAKDQPAGTISRSCEHLGAILKERVEQRLQNAGEDLLLTVANVLEEMEFDHELFVSLLESYPARLEAVRAAAGGHTKY